MKSKVPKSLFALLTGLVFLLYVILWYKQFSYFRYTGESYLLNDAELSAKAIGAAEKEFILDEGFSEKIGRIVFWPAKYSEIEIENNGHQAVMITLSDYDGIEIPSFQEPVRIAQGESYTYIADGRGSYVVTAYGAEPEDAGLLRIHYNNHAYMQRWKMCIYAVLAGLAAFTAISVLALLWKEEFYRKTYPWIMLAGGGITAFCKIALRLTGWEDWAYCGIGFLSVYLCCMAIVSAAGSSDAQEKDGRILRPLFAGGVSAAIALAVHFLFLSAKSSSILWHFTGSQDSNKRIVGYLIVFVVFAVCFLIMQSIKIPDAVIDRFGAFFRTPVTAGSVICIILSVCDVHNDWNWLSLISLAAILFMAGYHRHLCLPKGVWVFYYGCIAVVTALNHCVINFWDTRYNGDVYHTGTFYHALYYVANNKPFAGGLMQMYGHFPLFYKLPLVLFGNNMRTIGITTAVFSGVAVLSFLLFLHRTLKEDFIRLLSGVLILDCLIIDHLYLQTFPLRMFWPFVILAYGSFMRKKAGIDPMVRIGGCLLCMLAIVWNLESGLVCSIAWMVCVVAWDCKGTELKDYTIRLLKELPVVLIEILGAYLIVKVCNMIVTEPGNRIAELLDWKKEMATLAREEAGDVSNGKLFWGNAPWIFIETVLMCSVAFWLYRLIGRKQRIKGSDISALFLSVFSAGIFIYWMGRPEGYDIIAPFLAALLLIAYDRALNKNSAGMTEKSIYVISGFLLAVGIAGFMGHTIERLQYTKENLVDKKILSYASVKEYMDRFENEVPEEVYGEAYGIAMIDMSLGRRMETDGLGWGRKVDRLEEYARNQKWVVLNDESYPDVPYLREVKKIPFGSFTYVLYENTAAGQ